MAPKKSKKTAVKRTISSKPHTQINVLFMTVVIFLLALILTLILLRGDKMKKAATTPRHANYVDESVENFDPSRSQRKYFKHFDMVLPPLGKYVENKDGYGGMDEENDYVEFSWSQGGGSYKPAAKKGEAPSIMWSLAMFSLNGEYADVPQDFADRTDISSVIPASAVSIISKISVGESKRISSGNRSLTYTRLKDMYVQGKKISVFNVKQLPQKYYVDPNSLGRQDALFTDKGKTIFIKYEWMNERASEQFIPMLKSINFDVPAPTKAAK